MAGNRLVLGFRVCADTSVGAAIVRLTTCVLIVAPLTVAAQGVPRRGVNLLENPGFETHADGRAAGWTAYGNGYTLSEEAHNGRRGVRCSTDDPGIATGLMQEVVFDPPVQHTFAVSGWSKAEQAEDGGYCLYMDVWYEDGTNLWGQRGTFESETHDWQYLHYTFEVVKPVVKVQFFVLFRRTTGTAWFDDVSLSLAPFGILDERVTPSLYGGNSIDYSAAFSMPADWSVAVLQDGVELAQVDGRGRAATLSWTGTGPDGRARPGGEYRVRLTASDTGRREELRREHTVTTRSGRGRGYVAWTDSSMRRALVDAMPTEAQTRRGPGPVRIALAGNEYESFQVLIRAAPGRDLRGCRVEMADLVRDAGHRIPAARIEWHQVGFVKIDQLYQHPRMSHARPGWWPDPLLPVTRFDVPGGTTQALWFTLHVPVGTAAGTYRGTVRICPVGDRPIEVDVDAEVFAFSLPDQPHIKTAFALMEGYLEKLYGKPVSTDVRRAYGDYLLRHRLSPDDISRTGPPDLDDLVHYNGRGLNAFNVLNLVPPRGDRTWVCYAPLEAYTPALKQSFMDRLDPYVRELGARGLKSKAYVYCFDERGTDYHPVIREYFGMIRDRYGIPTLTTASIPQDPTVMRGLNIDWNCPLTSVYRLDAAEKCREAGQQVWAYICLGPRYPYANWLADDPLIEARLIWWQAYHQKFDGFLYWGLNIWGRANNDYLIDPGKDGPRLRWSISTGGNWASLHGDGELLYAGKDGPIGCIRLANIRDGIEDYEYLHRLGELTGRVDDAREACLPVTRSLTRFTRDPGTLYSQRLRVARRIEALLAVPDTRP